MGARFGFMNSNKAGKCYYCSKPINEGDRCAMDNGPKRRTCVDCAERLIAKDGATSAEQAPSGGAQVVDMKPLVDAMQSIENKLVVLVELLMRQSTYIPTGNLVVAANPEDPDSSQLKEVDSVLDLFKKKELQ